MTEPVTPPVISALPPAPLITDTPAAFNDKAFPFAQALEPLRVQINSSAVASNTNSIASKEGAVASAGSAAASAASVSDAANEANRSRDEADRSKAEADRSEDGADSALNAAAAAGAAAGLPIYSGKAGLSLVVKEDETGVGWSSAGFQIGGIYAGAVKPTLGVWLETNKFYYQAAYPMLAAAIGLVPAVASWTQRTQATLADTLGLAYGNGMFVAVGKTSGSASVGASSTDGVSWTARTIGDALAVTFAAGRFVAVGQSVAHTSTDGITWATHTAPSKRWEAVAYGAGLFVSVGSGGGASSSPDGVTWTLRTDDAFVSYCIAFGNNRFVSLGWNSGSGVTSTDGIEWVTFTCPNISPRGIAYGNGVFVAVGSGGAMTSTDGLIWISRPMPGVPVASASYQAVAFYSGRFIAVGSAATGNPVFADSPDGINWTQRFMPPGGYKAIIAGGGQIVAAGTAMQTAPMFPYNTATEFYVPAPLGVVGLKSWMKASDAGGQGPGNQEDYLAQVVGTGANQISANGMLGRQAFLDAVGEITPMLSRPATNGLIWFESASDTAVTICKRGTDGVVRVSSPLTLS